MPPTTEPPDAHAPRLVNALFCLICRDPRGSVKLDLSVPQAAVLKNRSAPAEGAKGSPADRGRAAAVSSHPANAAVTSLTSPLVSLYWIGVPPCGGLDVPERFEQRDVDPHAPAVDEESLGEEVVAEASVEADVHGVDDLLGRQQALHPVVGNVGIG
jgi:hypothetical protein